MLNLRERLLILEQQEKQLLQLLASIVVPGQAFTAHQLHGYLFVFGIGKRTIAQSTGFRSMIDARNFMCAAGLLRMQIDTAMRLNALNLVSNVNAFLDAWIAGTKLSKFKSADGQKMHDVYLIEQLGKAYPWVLEVYQQTSSFIHFSSRHAWATVTGLNEDERTFNFLIGPSDPDRPEEDYFEIVDAFGAANKMASDLTKNIFIQ